MIREIVARGDSVEHRLHGLRVAGIGWHAQL